MCRWLAYSGSPVLIEDLLYRSKHSLIVQSLHSQLGVIFVPQDRGRMLAFRPSA